MTKSKEGFFCCGKGRMLRTEDKSTPLGWWQGDRFREGG